MPGIFVLRAGERPGTELADDFLAGHGGVEHLEEKGPKERHWRVKALALSFGIGCFGEEVGGQQGTEQGGQIGQGQVSELLQLVDDTAGGGGLRSALKSAGEVGQKTSEKCHAA